MVTLQILVQSIQVRILVAQQNRPINIVAVFLFIFITTPAQRNNNKIKKQKNTRLTIASGYYDLVYDRLYNLSFLTPS